MPTPLTRHIFWAVLLLAAPFLRAQSSLAELREQTDSLHTLLYNEQTFARAEVLRKAIEQADDPLLNCQINNWYGEYYSRLANYPKALEFLEKALEKAIEASSQEALADTRMNIGHLRLLMGDHEQAEDHFLEVIELRRELGDTIRMGMTQLNLALVEWRTGRLDRGLQRLLSLREVFQNAGVEELVLRVDQNLGGIYAQMGRPDQALPYVRSVLETGMRSRDTFNFGPHYGNLAYTYQQLGNFEQALVYYDSSLYYAQHQGRDAVAYVTHLDMSDGYAGVGDYQNALKHYQDYHKLYAKVISEESKESFAVLEARFETERKEQALAASQQEIKVLEQEAKIRNQRFWMAIAALISVLLLAFSVNQWWRNRTRRRETEAKLIATELEKQKLEATILKTKLADKEADLTDFALDIGRKNQFSTKLLDRLDQLQTLPADKVQAGLSDLIRFTTTHLQLNQDLKLLHQNVDSINQEFYRNLDLRFSGLSAHDKYLAGLLRLNLSNKDIAAVKGISVSSAKMARYRLRKKLELDPEVDVVAFLKNV